MKRHLLCVIVCCAVLLTGCSHHLGTMSYISTKEVDPHYFGEAEKVGTNVAGKNVHWFVLFDFTLSPPQWDKAVDDALAKAGGDYMTNATLKLHFFFIPILYYRVWLEVTGDVWKVKPHPTGDGKT